MYRLKDAIIIFWAVLTHKYYWFFSIDDFKDGKRVGKGHQFNSDEVERDTFYSLKFRETALEFITMQVNGEKFNRYAKKYDE